MRKPRGFVLKFLRLLYFTRLLHSQGFLFTTFYSFFYTYNFFIATESTNNRGIHHSTFQGHLKMLRGAWQSSWWEMPLRVCFWVWAGTYSFVKCTPPFKPLSNTPLPLPPAKIWAFRTISFASKVGKKIGNGLDVQGIEENGFFRWHESAAYDPDTAYEILMRTIHFLII